MASLIGTLSANGSIICEFPYVAVGNCSRTMAQVLEPYFGATRIASICLGIIAVLATFGRLGVRLKRGGLSTMQIFVFIMLIFTGATFIFRGVDPLGYSGRLPFEVISFFDAVCACCLNSVTFAIALIWRSLLSITSDGSSGISRPLKIILGTYLAIVWVSFLLPILIVPRLGPNWQTAQTFLSGAMLIANLFGMTFFIHTGVLLHRKIHTSMEKSAEDAVQWRNTQMSSLDDFIVDIVLDENGETEFENQDQHDDSELHQEGSQHFSSPSDIPKLPSRYVQCGRRTIEKLKTFSTTLISHFLRVWSASKIAKLLVAFTVAYAIVFAFCLWRFIRSFKAERMNGWENLNECLAEQRAQYGAAFIAKTHKELGNCKAEFLTPFYMALQYIILALSIWALWNVTDRRAVVGVARGRTSTVAVSRFSNCLGLGANRYSSDPNRRGRKDSKLRGLSNIRSAVLCKSQNGSGEGKDDNDSLLNSTSSTTSYIEGDIALVDQLMPDIDFETPRDSQLTYESYKEGDRVDGHEGVGPYDIESVTTASSDSSDDNSDTTSV